MPCLQNPSPLWTVANPFFLLSAESRITPAVMDTNPKGKGYLPLATLFLLAGVLYDTTPPSTGWLEAARTGDTGGTGTCFNLAGRCAFPGVQLVLLFRPKR